MKVHQKGGLAETLAPTKLCLDFCKYGSTSLDRMIIAKIGMTFFPF